MMDNQEESDVEKLEVICDTISQHPHCVHGPTLLFRRYNKLSNEIIEEYYACSACRNLDGCKFYLLKSDYDKGKIKKIPQQLPYNLDFQKIYEIRKKVSQADSTKDKFYYCHSCSVLCDRNDLNNHHNGHKRQTVMLGHLIKMPTQFLRPQSNDKAEAQYFFTNSTLEFFMNLLKDLKISKVCCMGAPRLHERLKFSYKNYGIESFLLDIDHRFFYFFNDNEFAWFNMFNFHFFEGNKKREVFENFLKVKYDEICLLFIDPPFGCRTEPLVQTIKEISKIYKQINSSSHILPIIWIFPYFMETYIKTLMPEMKMIDYKVNYDNHVQYSNPIVNPKARKHGSPVRLFTNIPDNLIKLPEQEGYKFCSVCDRWTYIENEHCELCKECPSKNGETYNHCSLCMQCFKPSYEHCLKCGHCVQKLQHTSCEFYQKQLTCWICKRKGHTELKCDDWFKYCKRHFYKTHSKILEKYEDSLKRGSKICLICTKIGDHNEKNCPKRKYFLKEKYFLSECVNIFRGS